MAATDLTPADRDLLRFTFRRVLYLDSLLWIRDANQRLSQAWHQTLMSMPSADSGRLREILRDHDAEPLRQRLRVMFALGQGNNKTLNFDSHQRQREVA